MKIRKETASKNVPLGNLRGRHGNPEYDNLASKIQALKPGKVTSY